MIPRALGNFYTPSVNKFPMVVAVLRDSNHNAITAFVQEAPSVDVAGVVDIDGAWLKTEFTMGDFTYSEIRPTNGGGIRARSVSFTVSPVGDEQEGLPYTSEFDLDKLLNRLYLGGISYSDLYFDIYGIDRSNQLKPLSTAWYIGAYTIDDNTQWNESSGETRFNLVDLLESEDSYIGSTDSEIEDTIFIYNPWYNGRCIPTAYGMIPRIRTLNGFPSIDTKDLASSYTGVMGAAYTALTTEFILAVNVTEESGHALLPLAVAGATVRIKLHDGEVVRGVLSYDAVNEQIKLTSATRNEPYAEGEACSYTSFGIPIEEAGVGAGIPSMEDYLKMFVNNGRATVQDPSAWAQANFDFYDNTDPNNTDTQTINFRLTGFGNEEDSVKHEAIAHPTTGLNSHISVGYSTTDNPIIVNDDGTVFKSTKRYIKNGWQPVDFYFVDPAIGAGTGELGDPWWLVNIDNLSVDIKSYIKDGYSKFDVEHVYAEGDGRLIRIPSENITITTGVTAFGESNLVEIELTDSPINLDIGATSNIIYVDALYKDGTNDERLETILYNIIDQNCRLINGKLGSTFTTQLSNNSFTPYIGYLATAEESTFDVLNRICYQASISLDWVANKLHIVPSVAPSSNYYEDDATTRTIKNTTDLYPNHLLLDDSLRFSVEAKNTITHEGAYDYKAFYYSVSFGSWEDPYSPVIKGKSKRRIPKEYSQVSYHFDLINDQSSAEWAAGQTVMAGHCSGLSLTGRKFTFGCDLSALFAQTLNVVRLIDLPYFTDRDHSPVFSIVDNKFVYQLPTEKKEFGLNGVGVINSINLSINAEDYELDIEVEQTQLNSEPVISWFNSPPQLPPDEPPVPPNDPNDPPGLGSYTTHSWSPLLTGKTYSISSPTKTPSQIESDDGIEIEYEVTTEDTFRNGFTLTMEAEGAVFLTHVVGDGSNIGSPITTIGSIVITPDFMGGEQTKLLTVNVKVAYNNNESLFGGVTWWNEEFTLQVNISVATAPDIIAS